MLSLRLVYVNIHLKGGIDVEDGYQIGLVVLSVVIFAGLALIIYEKRRRRDFPRVYKELGASCVFTFVMLLAAVYIYVNFGVTAGLLVTLFFLLMGLILVGYVIKKIQKTSSIK
ncbi:hypothetical protein [Melghiribacillus thermohalophilus]|uniref:hypothetical protein n=1 Tax=Melghiribacillus thermohalophilus TaxID=1324956 RepID=UPI00104A3098|nr:hypothetical protein [Melghiribacillus thermohalophilus]